MLSLIGVLVMTAIPFVKNQYRKAVVTSAVSNSRQIGICLFEFEADYGKFPDSTTIAAVKKKTGTLLPLGTGTSNDYFRQLIAAGLGSSESYFYANIPGSRKPDGRMDGVHAVERGECGYSYLAGQSSLGNPARPIVITPLIPGTDRFYATWFEGKAIILKLDHSVILVNIDKAGHGTENGDNILDPANPVWGGKPPVIAWPE